MSLEHARPDDGGGHAHAQILYGSQSIADYLGITQRAVLHLIETKRLPVFWLGKRPAARPATLMAWLEEQERQALEAADG